MSESLYNPREVAQAISWSRRDFLRATTGATAGTALFGLAPRRAMALPRGRKAIVVTFGGGARDEETFMPDGQENIPHLLADLIPRATFFTQVVNR
ncbi:MAG: twin-arginine translocation signal domain-containing protein [Bryobacteraceae bacterium]